MRGTAGLGLDLDNQNIVRRISPSPLLQPEIDAHCDAQASATTAVQRWLIARGGWEAQKCFDYIPGGTHATELPTARDTPTQCAAKLQQSPPRGWLGVVPLSWKMENWKSGNPKLEIRKLEIQNWKFGNPNGFLTFLILSVKKMHCVLKTDKVDSVWFSTGN